MPEPSDIIAKRVAKIVQAVELGLDDALNAIGIETVNTVRLLITKPSPSAPGEPPGLITGGLRLSYRWEVGSAGGVKFVMVGSDEAVLQPITGLPVDYAKWLEFGTSKMEARPHLRPAIEIVRPLIPVIVKNAVQARVKVAIAQMKAT